MKLRSLLAAVAILCAIVTPAHAQKTKAQLNSEVGTQFPDNTVNAITPQNLRTVTQDVINSIMPTAPVVPGNIACWNGSTGLLQDCGVSPGNSAQFGSRAAAVSANIPTPLTSIYVNGYATTGDGGAGTYIKLLSAPAPVKAWQFQSADGAWWQLQTNPVVPKQVGAKLDGATDDSVPMQAWFDYGATFGVVSIGQPGIANIPTATLNISGSQVISGANALTIQRTSNVVSSLIDCNTHNNVTISDLTISTTAGFSSTSTNTIGLTTQNYTVPAGLVGLVVGNFVQITANSSNAAHVNYEIAQINSYSGTTLNVTATTAVGSGTFSVWLIDVYPLNGDLAASNIGLRFTACNNAKSINNTVTGRFYNALDSRNGSDVTFANNSLSGWVNRGIHMAAYTNGAGSINNQALYNHLEGGLFAQYGVNTSASDGAVASGFIIHGNRIAFTTFQGIIVGGGVTFSSVSNNSIQLAFNNNGAGIIVENLVGTTGSQIPQYIAVNHNTIDLGAQGLFINNTFYNSWTGNIVSGAGTGALLQGGSSASTTSYQTLTGNIFQASVSSGISLVGGVASGITNNSVVGNTLIANGAWGIISDSNTANGNYSGNVGSGNTSGNYSLGGTGNVTTGGNL